MHLLGRARTTRRITATAGTTLYNYNLYTAAGSPTSRIDVVLIVPVDTIIGSQTSAAALVTGTGWATYTTLRIIVYGAIGGRGGAGNGYAGGHAISLSWPIIVENYGYIRGGGGGGGLGRELYVYPNTWNAGGGGGGQGCVGGALGIGGTTLPGYTGNHPDGYPGSEQGPGAGGDGAYTDYLGVVRSGGGGGSGGSWGMSGDPGGRNSNNDPGYAGGAAGYAIKQNSAGNIVTWDGGYSGSPHVKGTVGV
jgi:hypothetical protein